MKPLNRPFVLFLILLNCTGSAQNPSKTLNKESRDKIMAKIGDLLVNNYVEKEAGLACLEFLERAIDDGKYDDISHPRKLSTQLNNDLMQIHHDRHIRLQFIPADDRNFEIENPILFFLLSTQDRMKENLGIRDVKILSGNVGYLDIRNFEPLDLARKKLINTLELLKDVDALIIDLRNNNGGNPNTVQFLCSWFFDSPVHLNSIYWRRGDYTEEFWTIDDIGIKKEPGLPLYILTGSRTFSAAEEFAYNLKIRKRATLIGEKTAGGANPGYSFSVSDQFSIFIPTGRSVNPVTKTNWEGSGIEPDIFAEEAGALNFAHEKALQAGRIFRETQNDEVVLRYMKLRDDLNLADSLFRSGETDRAKRLLERSLEEQLLMELVGEWTINALGYQFLAEQKMNVALSLFEINAANFPSSANAWDSLGEGYYNIKDWEKALAAYKQSFSINPRNQNAQLMLRKIQEKIDGESR